MTESESSIFIICPIGAEGSPVRKQSDLVLKFILEPVAQDMGYSIERADTIMESGLITSQIFNRLVTAPLVIADLSGHNPNVFYELAVRHAVRKPVIHLIAKGQTIPFDIASNRALFYELELEGVESAKQSLTQMIREATRDDPVTESPISEALARVQLSASAEPSERRDAELLSMVSDIRTRLSILEILSPSSQKRHTLLEFTEILVEFVAYAESALPAADSKEDLYSMIESFYAVLEQLNAAKAIDEALMSTLRHPSRARIMTTLLDKITPADETGPH